MIFELRGSFDILQKLAQVNPLDARAPIAEAMLEQTKRNFDRESSPFMDPWEPLKHRAGKPLQDTRVLYNSMQPVISRDAAGVGTNVNYAVTHQFGAKQGQYGTTSRGGPIPWGDVPARPFLPLVDTFGQLPGDYQSDIIQTIEALYESVK